MEDPSNDNAGKQLDPGQKDQLGNEVTIKKSEGISDQGNEWSDKEEISDNEGILGEKAEKYVKDSADIEDLPEEVDEREADKAIESTGRENEKMVDDDDGENEDDVIENPEDYVPGYDLGRNKVQ